MPIFGANLRRSEKTAGNPEKFKALVNSKDPNIYVVILDS
jgi:hypothetical protein